MFTTKRDYEILDLQILGELVKIKDQIKYWGLELHRMLDIRAHLEAASKKTHTTAVLLSRLMPNLGGAVQRKRRLLAIVVDSKMLYGSLIWVGALVQQRNIETILKPRRVLSLITAML